MLIHFYCVIQWRSFHSIWELLLLASIPSPHLTCAQGIRNFDASILEKADAWRLRGPMFGAFPLGCGRTYSGPLHQQLAYKTDVAHHLNAEIKIVEMKDYGKHTRKFESSGPYPQAISLSLFFVVFQFLRQSYKPKTRAQGEITKIMLSRRACKKVCMSRYIIIISVYSKDWCQQNLPNQSKGYQSPDGPSV